jgi:hypothetical protein
LINESSINYSSSEEYIENIHTVDVKFILKINCEVKQHGYKTELLRDISTKLKVNKNLKFFIEYTDVARPYTIKWKIKNEGEIAKRRNNLRGEIIMDDGTETRYFTCAQGAGSFVKVELLSGGISLIEAIDEK